MILAILFLNKHYYGLKVYLIFCLIVLFMIDVLLFRLGLLYIIMLKFVLRLFLVLHVLWLLNGVFDFMCLFPLPNLNFNSPAYRRGVKEFSCGSCPECLQKRSSSMALTSLYEAKMHSHNLMITLTYDKFKYFDRRGNIEIPPDPDLKVNKVHVQKFIKRLRRWIEYNKPFGCDSVIKYRACAEYGSRTHRAHYHVLLFGVNFPDMHYYKKSKRGNVIYMSPTLTKLWGHGICTIDSKNVFSAVARYCTKYVAKSRSDKTFMLSSQKLGLSKLLSDFNGKPYIIDGRSYAIPRTVWQEYISLKYSRFSKLFDWRYVNHSAAYKSGVSHDRSAYDSAALKRKFYRWFRDKDPIYKDYIKQCSYLSELYNLNRPSCLQRLLNLPDDKYHFYKIAALKCMHRRRFGSSFPAPGSGCISSYFRIVNSNKLPSYWLSRLRYVPRSLPYPSCPNTASDTNKFIQDPFDFEIYRLDHKFDPINSFLCRKGIDKIVF